MPQAVIGCDLSRAVIDICELPSGRIGQIANTSDAITGDCQEFRVRAGG